MPVLVQYSSSWYCITTSAAFNHHIYSLTLCSGQSSKFLISVPLPVPPVPANTARLVLIKTIKENDLMLDIWTLEYSSRLQIMECQKLLIDTGAIWKHIFSEFGFLLLLLDLCDSRIFSPVTLILLQPQSHPTHFLFLIWFCFVATSYFRAHC